MAIALDNSAVSQSASFSYTSTGTNLVMVAFVFAINDTAGVPTYNGTSMTLIGKTTFLGGQRAGVYAYYLIAPATGSNTFAVSGTFQQVMVGTYTGAKQSSQPDAFTVHNQDSSSSSITTSVTTVADKCWAMYGVSDSGSVPVAGTGMTKRQDGTAAGDGNIFGDSNGAITPAGSYSMTATYTSCTANVGIAISIAPVPLSNQIAFGGIAAATTNAQTGTSVAVSGPNTVGFLFTQGDVAADNISAVTWGGVSMTKVTAVKIPSDRWLSLWWIANPSSAGAISLTGGSFWNWDTWYYTGASQSSPIDSFNTGTVSTTAALTVATTVVASGCWYVEATANNAGAATYTSTGTLRLSSSNGNGMGSILDSNGTVSTGSQSRTSTCSSSFTQGGIAFSVAPFVVSATTGNFFTFFGN